MGVISEGAMKVQLDEAIAQRDALLKAIEEHQRNFVVPYPQRNATLYSTATRIEEEAGK
jgi:hypothetical protein